MSTDRSPFGVYIHWPFCAQKCPYCDFNSHVRFGGWDEPAFLKAYQREIDHVAGLTGPREVTSIFFGGGTPSLMRAETTAAILDHLAARWTISPGAEITLEANPGSVEAARFRGYRAAGVNRVSIGVQSLRNAELKKLGRVHSVDEAKAALGIARDTFERFSFDLIYARPGQSPSEWRLELAEALAMAGEHLSLYQLTIEPDTPYAALHARGKLVVPDADAARDLYQLTGEMTAAHGLEAYEVSNYARPGAESRHNLLYWRYGEYAGIGPGAHGRILVGGRHATIGERNPEGWLAKVNETGSSFVEFTALTPEEQVDEMLLMGLRLSEGIDLDALAELGGLRPSADRIEGLRALGLLEYAPAVKLQSSGPPVNWRSNELNEIVHCSDGGQFHDTGTVAPAGARRIRATSSGRLVLNAVVAELSKSLSAPRRMDNEAANPY